MARTQQINPRISAMARDLLQQACEARGCSQSDLVESALTAFLTQTGEGEHQTLVLQQLTVLEETLTGIVGLLQTVIARLEGQVSAPEPEKPPIATYEQMYGPIEAAPQPFIGVETPWEPPVRASVASPSTATRTACGGRCGGLTSPPATTRRPPTLTGVTNGFSWTSASASNRCRRCRDHQWTLFE